MWLPYYPRITFHRHDSRVSANLAGNRYEQVVIHPTCLPPSTLLFQCMKGVVRFYHK